jgi:hypothetical protein
MSSVPIVAVVGSASQKLADQGNYDPKITDIPGAREAARLLGEQFAKIGWHLQVYSLHEGYIESDVVKGYADAPASQGTSRLVYIDFPTGNNCPPDPVKEGKKKYNIDFIGNASPFENWEVSFYRGLSRASAVVVVGGGKSTLATGLLALTRKIPLFSVATYGGSARTVWQAIEVETDLPTAAHKNAMGMSINDAHQAARCVTALDEQMAALKKSEEARGRSARRRANTWFTIVGALALSLTVFCALHWLGGISLMPPFLALMGAAVGGGVAGAALLGLLGGVTSMVDLPEDVPVTAALLFGAAVGFVAGLIFILGQTATLPDAARAAENAKKAQLLNMIPFVAVISIIAGMTWNKYIAKLRKTEIPSAIPTQEQARSST